MKREKTKIIRVTAVDPSPELKQVMALVSNGLSLVKAIRKIRGTREVELMPVGRRGVRES